MHDDFGDDRGPSTRVHIVRCALDDIRERLDDLAPSPRRDTLAVEALSCSEALARLEQAIGAPIEAREALVRRIIDLEIAVLELGRVPAAGSWAPTEPPHGAASPAVKKARAKRTSPSRHDATKRFA